MLNEPFKNDSLLDLSVEQLQKMKMLAEIDKLKEETNQVKNLASAKSLSLETANEEKVKAEINKLKEETNQIKKPWYRQSAFLGLLVSISIPILSIIATYFFGGGKDLFDASEKNLLYDRKKLNDEVDSLHKKYKADSTLLAMRYDSLQHRDSVTINASVAITENLNKRITNAGHVVIDTSQKSINNLAKKTILWVDDDSTNNISIIKYLRSLGRTVMTATSTANALQILVNKQYQITDVISDMKRIEDGIEIVNAGEQLYDNLKNRNLLKYFIVYSASQFPPAKERLKNQGIIVTNNYKEVLDFIDKH